MNDILIMLAHPRYEKSRANRALLEAVSDLPRVLVHDLYELYPDFNIDVEREHDVLLRHAVLVWQFPLYMYSPPAMLKQWLDLVLEHGWAHGAGGRNLEGRQVFCAVTTGGGSASYGPQGFNRYSLQEFLRPLEQTAGLCKMTWLPPFAVQGIYRLSTNELGHRADLYRRALERLAAGDCDRERICRRELLNDWIESEERRVAP